MVVGTQKEKLEARSDEEHIATASARQPGEASLSIKCPREEVFQREKRSKLHIEVVVHPLCPTPPTTLRREWQSFLDSIDQLPTKNGGADISGAPSHLQESCIRFDLDTDDEDKLNDGVIDIKGNSNAVEIHPYTLSEEEPSTEDLDAAGANDDEQTAGCDHLPLPHATLDGLWDSLILPPGVKHHLLDYAQSSLLFSRKGVSPHIVGWNRLLLLHGPPGTGKTSLCRALAQKLAIRMGRHFPSGSILLEIHSHSLFSKWFSTSGKLVNRLFQVIRDMVQDDPQSLVCVLIDEVESLACARSSLGGAGEPSDAMRAVNSLLTSLDRLRSFPNVLVLATTNLTGSVDLAFVDRADVKQYVGMPILEARFEILRTCLLELVRVGIVDALTDKQLESFRDAQSAAACKSSSLGVMLLECTKAAAGLSGRSLRKLPLQTHAQFIGDNESVSMKEFLHALRFGIDAEHKSKEKLTSRDATL